MADLLLFKHRLGFDSKVVLPDNCFVRIENGCQLCVYQRKDEPWSGAGLPPIGTVCEWHPSVHGWVTVTILGRDGDCTWYRVKGEEASQTCRHMTFFRPIRTPEQIAAERYEEDAKEIAKILSDLDGADDIFVAKTLLDCGYRKFEITDE